MPYHQVIRGERFTFADLRDLLAKANEEKSGDQLAGIAAHTERERVAAKIALADVHLSEIVDQPVVDADRDEVTRVCLETFHQDLFRSIRSWTVGEFREYLLADTVGEAALHKLRWAITPEVAAAAAKLMSNKDL